MKNTPTIMTLLIFLLLCIGCSNNGNKPEQIFGDSDKEILRHIKEVEWPKAYAEQDTLLLDRILGDNFQMIDQSGNWYNKKDEMEWIKENTMQHDSFHYEIKRFEILENGTALICGTGHIVNDSVESIYQSSNVLVKRKGQWKAVLSHVSGLKSSAE